MLKVCKLSCLPSEQIHSHWDSKFVIADISSFSFINYMIGRGLNTKIFRSVFLWKSFFTMIIFFLFHCWFLQHLHVFLILLLRWAIITAQCFSLSERLCIYIMRHTVTVFEPFSFQIIIIILYDFVHITLPFWNSFDKTIQGSTSFGRVLHWMFFPLRDSFFPFNLCILPLVSCNRYAMWLVTDWESLFSHFLKRVLGSFFPLHPRRNFCLPKNRLAH